MKDITPYLFFNGNCREAMTFYGECLGAEPQMMPYAEGNCPEGLKNKIMHAKVAKGSAYLMASDLSPAMPYREGNNFSVCMNCESLEEIERLFAALGAGGKVTYPLNDTFWGARFGTLVDKFGINWMFNFDKAKNQ